MMPQQARQVAFVASAQEVGNRELAELAQIWRQKQGHQTVAAGPAHDERQTAVAGEVERSGHADERRRAHPVGPGGHAVVDRGHAPTSDVVLGRVRRAAHDADAGIQRHGREQEDQADVVARQSHLFGDGKKYDECNEAARIPGVDLVELLLEAAIRGRAERATAARAGCHACHVIPPRLPGHHAGCPDCSCSAHRTR